jgi:hypothetical protein
MDGEILGAYEDGVLNPMFNHEIFNQKGDIDEYVNCTLNVNLREDIPKGTFFKYVRVLNKKNEKGEERQTWYFMDENNEVKDCFVTKEVANAPENLQDN